MDGRAAMMMRSPRWKPAVSRSRSVNPLAAPVGAPWLGWSCSSRSMDAQITAAHQLVAQGDGVDHIAALRERDHRTEQQAVALAIEHRVVEDLGGLEGRVLIEQHGAEHRLLRFITPRSLAAGELALRRGDGGRYGRHPRSASSNWGSGAGRPDGT